MQQKNNTSKINMRNIVIGLSVLTIITIAIAAYWLINSGGMYQTESALEIAKTALWFDEFKINTAEPDVIQTEEDEVIEDETPEKEEVQPATSDTNENTNYTKDEVASPIKANWWDYPDPILSTTKSGNDLLVLVNKQYQLPSTYAPTDLVTISGVGCRLPKTLQARSIVINELKALCEAADTDNIDLSLVSSYRSFATQQSTYQYWVNFNGGGVTGIAAADTVSARPGHSQHQLGTTLDFSTLAAGDRVGSTFHETAAANWLEGNAWKYGFVIAYPKGYETTTGYSYESWHFRFIGVENARVWKESGEVLENFLD